jgi:hypothetical protein
MRRFVLGWKKLGLEQRLGSRIVTYADDLVILCKKGLQKLRKIMSKLKLTMPILQGFAQRFISRIRLLHFSNRLAIPPQTSSSL